MDLIMPLGSIVVSKDVHRPDQFDTGGVGGDNHDRLLLVLGCGGVGFSHDQMDGCARISGSGNPPFDAVDDDVVAFLDDGSSAGGEAAKRVRTWAFGAGETHMLVASEDATPFSVMAKEERISPFNRGLSHFSFCASVPYRANTSASRLQDQTVRPPADSAGCSPMLPVSLYTFCR